MNGNRNMENHLELENQNQELKEALNETTQTESVQADATIAEKEASASSFKEKQEENFRRFREKVEAERREYQDKLNSLQQQLASAKNSNLNDDDIAEGRHISAIQKEIIALRDEIKQERQKQTLMHDELKIQSEIPDINKVVSPKNLEILKKKFPHLHANIASAPDLYTRAKVAHTLITQMGIAEQAQNDQLVDNNLSKPGNPSRGSALSQKNLYDNDMSEQEMKERWREIQRNAGGIM